MLIFCLIAVTFVAIIVLRAAAEMVDPDEEVSSTDIAQ